jgi:hypothetical protein
LGGTTDRDTQCQTQHPYSVHATECTPVDVNRPYRNFAPFVRQTGERKAQTCAKAIYRVN